jgi:hypothetical protein
MSGEPSSKRGPGRPARTSAPFVIRGVVPESHPHYEKLKALGSAGAARAVLQMLANPLENATPSPSHGSMSSLPPSNSLSLNISSPPANSIQVVNQTNAAPLQLDADLSDLLSFTGTGG